jgi:hypothetical protein
VLDASSVFLLAFGWVGLIDPLGRSGSIGLHAKWLHWSLSELFCVRLLLTYTKCIPRIPKNSASQHLVSGAVDAQVKLVTGNVQNQC